MKPPFKKISLLLIASILVGLFTFSTNPYGEGDFQELMNKSSWLNEKFPQEKIYLHLDRPSY